MDSPAPAARRSTMRRDVVSAYVATAARVLSWVAVTSLVYRVMGNTPFAMLALVRATVGLLGYASFGLAPAIVRALAASNATYAAMRDRIEPAATPPGATLSYAVPEKASAQTIYSNAMIAALTFGAVGAVIAAAYAFKYDTLHVVPILYRGEDLFFLVFLFAAGVIARVISDVPGAVLQLYGRITLDNILLAFSEVAWVGLSAGFVLHKGWGLPSVSLAYFISQLCLLLIRFERAREFVQLPRAGLYDPRMTSQLLSFGGLVVLAQLADFLYAPIDFVLINRFLAPVAVADYAPAVQIDGALHMLVIGIASVLLPKTAIAHAAGDVATVRRYYVRGTLASVGITLPAALLVWTLSPWIFQLWLDEPMPTTEAILPLVLLHNLIGGSGTVGRSVLLAMGRVKPYAVSVLIAGVANVVISYLLVRYTNLGLYGIVLGTICAVTGRALLWQPWYVMRAIRLAALEQPLAPEVAESIAQVEMRDAP